MSDITKRPRITSKNIVEIVLDDGSKVSVRGGLPYKAFKSVVNLFKQNKEQGGAEDMSIAEIEGSIDFLKQIVVSWDFIDSGGNVVDYSPELIEELDVNTVAEITRKASLLYTPEKKS